MEERQNPLRTDEGLQAPEEQMVKASEIQAIVAAAVAAALAQTKHQHTPFVPEMVGRTRADGVLIEEKVTDNKQFTEVRYNDGMVRRDYK